jgi:TolB-like protein
LGIKWLAKIPQNVQSFLLSPSLGRIVGITAMAKLSIKLLGGYRVYDGEGNELTLPTRKARALLAFLALSMGQWHSRDRLAGLLWSDRQDAQARHSLTQALGSIRKMAETVEVGLIESDGERIRLLGTETEVDALAFRNMQDRDPTSAVELYPGPLLDGFSVPDPAFQDWLAGERAVLQEIACSTIERAADSRARSNDTRGAIKLVKRLLALDPYCETGHRRLMEFYAKMGDRTAAIRQYQACERLLRDELSVAPAEETKVLLRSIKGGTLPSRADSGEVDEARPETVPLSVPDKGSIGVLPFANLSDGAEQEYFADGITEEIIMALSNVRTFTVLARNSTFAYKGKAVDAKEIGSVLGVHYLVEGSVRRAGDRVRVTAKLIDATTGDHIWAERYDGTLDDIFDVQDRITSTIVGTIEPELVRAEARRVGAKRPDNMDAYDHLLRGLGHMYKLTPEDTHEALKCFESAIELDSKYGLAHVYASWCYRRDVQQRGLMLSDEDQRKALNLAYTGLRLARDDPFVLAYSAETIIHIERNFEEGLALIDRAISLNSNSHRFWNSKAEVHVMRGETEAAIAAAERAIGLSPNNPAIWVSHYCIAKAHLQELRFEQAVRFAKQSIRHNHYNASPYLVWAAAAAQLGHREEARQALEGAIKITPQLTVGRFAEFWPVARYKNLDAYLDGLRKAGLPE